MSNPQLEAALQALELEKLRIEGAISAMQALLNGDMRGSKRRGRPPGSGKKHKTPKWSNAARKAAAARMKKYWAERRAKEA